MVRVTAPALTKLSFKRDVRSFLALLVGFLVALILVLLLVYGQATGAAGAVMTARWQTAADAAADALAAERTLGSSVLDARLIYLRTRYGIDAIAVTPFGGKTVISGPTSGDFEGLDRAVQNGKITCYFDRAPLQDLRRRFLWSTIISIAATATGAILLLLYLPKITRPIEALLDQASQVSERASGQDETNYLIETFRTSVAAMKAQEEELKRLHALQKSRADDLERVTAALTRSLTSGFVAIDPAGNVVDLNSAARDILDVTADVAGRSVVSAFGDGNFSHVLDGAFARRAALSRTEVDEGQRLIGLTTVPLIGDEQQFLGMLALFTDLTALRELETRVRDMQSLADLGEISAGIAHEFRNSLSTILGYLRLVRKNAPGAVEKAEAEASNLSKAVDGLLAFARPMRVAAQPIDLLDLTSETAERLSVMDDGVKLHCSGAHAKVNGDPALLGRAVENLLRNAVDSVMRKGGGGTVDVSVGDSPHPSITIKDDGVGFDPAEVPRLFLPFQAGHAKGHGLGLPLAKKIVLVHGGVLRLTGEPGKGATAYVEFLPTAS